MLHTCHVVSHLIMTSHHVTVHFTASLIVTELVTSAHKDTYIFLAINQSPRNHLDLLPDKSGAIMYPSFIMMSRRKLALGALYLHNPRYKMTA